MSRWMGVVILVAGAVLALACDAPSPGAPKLAPSISPTELQQQREQGGAPVVIDVRSEAEYAAGHVPGAIHIPFDQVAERIGEIDTSEGVALYCMVGPRARKGEAALIAAGHDDVYHLEGGLQAWQAAGLDVESAGTATTP